MRLVGIAVHRLGACIGVASVAEEWGVGVTRLATRHSNK